MLPLEVDMWVMGVGELAVVMLVGMARAEVVEPSRQVVVVVRHVVVVVGVDNPLVVVLPHACGIECSPIGASFGQCQIALRRWYVSTRKAPTLRPLGEAP